MTQDERRTKNRETVARFFTTHGPARAELFAENGAKEIPFPATYGQKWRWDGKQAVIQNLTSNKTLFTNWRWEGLTIDDTQDPDKFWAEAIGKGEQSVGEDGAPKQYENHYIFCFRMQDGLILEMREFHNPLALLHSLGAQMPKVPSPDETDARLREK